MRGFLINRANRLIDKAHDEYFTQQNRRYAAEMARDELSSARVVIDADGNERVAQPPMQAVVRITGVSSECGPSVVNRSFASPPKPRPVLDPIPGSPVDLTVGEIKRMLPDERAVALRRIMAVDGARERMNQSKLAGSTLTASLERELEYQRIMIRDAKRANKLGKTERIMIRDAKRANKLGAHPLRDGGVASFKGTGVRIVSTGDTPEYVTVTKLRRGQSLINKPTK